VEENSMYIEFILGIFLFVLILGSLPTKNKVKLENVDCILNEELKDKKFKKLYEKEFKKLQAKEEKLEQDIVLRELWNNKKDAEYDKKLLIEGYKETAKIIKEEQMETRKVNGEEVVEFTSVDEMLDDLHSHRGWTILDYIISYWHRYFWNFVSDIPLRVKTFIQRGMRGWADSDTWCLDYYIAKVISEGVQHLIKYGNSCWTKKDLASLKEIIKTFETANEINGHNLLYTESKKFTWATYKKQKRTCAFMNKKGKYPRDRKYRVMTLREVLRFEKGFDTFKDKFFYLWD
jgi:hypothetical protein